MVMLQEISQLFHSLGQHLYARQIHNAEMVGLMPVETTAARDQNLLPMKQVERELLIVGNAEFLHVKLGEDVKRRPLGFTTETPSMLHNASYTKLRCSYTRPPGTT